jgi:exopolysaccharide biosynthesis polyprenyl glycosylphosphotransferase
VPVRQVVLDRDVRSAYHLSANPLVHRFALRRSLSIIALGLFDIAAVFFGVFAASPLWSSLTSAHLVPPSMPAVLLAASLTMAVAGTLGLYGMRRARNSRLRVLHAAFWVLFFLSLLLGATPTHVTTGPLLLMWLLAACVMISLRRAYDLMLDALLGPGLDERRVILVGSAIECERVREVLPAATPGVRYKLLGALSDTQLPQRWQELTGLVSLGGLARFDAILEQHLPDEVVIADTDLVREFMEAIIFTCRRRHVTLKVAPPSDLGPDRVAFLPGFSSPIFAVSGPPSRSGEFVVKRAMDLVLASLTLVFAAPLMLVVALVVKLTSPGPVIYASERVGLGQRLFKCYKFRTMYADADARQAELEELNEATGAIFKMTGDPRITRAGRTLRRLSIDELPQFYNILKGDMSLVGPRPLPLRDNRLMEDWCKRRHVVLPGLTGAWQIGGRSGLGFDDMVKLDFHYIDTWSLRTDIAIFVKTLAIVFTGRGAY